MYIPSTRWIPKASGDLSFSSDRRREAILKERRSRVHECFEKFKNRHTGLIHRRELKLSTIALTGYKLTKMELDQAMFEHQKHMKEGAMDEKELLSFLNSRLDAIEGEDLHRQVFNALTPSTQHERGTSPYRILRMGSIVSPHSSTRIPSRTSLLLLTVRRLRG